MARDSITLKKVHPVKGKLVDCLVLLNYFGPGEDAYKFKGENVVYMKEELMA